MRNDPPGILRFGFRFPDICPLHGLSNASPLDILPMSRLLFRVSTQLERGGGMSLEAPLLGLQARAGTSRARAPELNTGAVSSVSETRACGQGKDSRPPLLGPRVLGLSTGVPTKKIGLLPAKELRGDQRNKP